MYYKEIAQVGYDFILKRLEEQRNMTQDGGALRNFSGQTVEMLIDLIFEEFKKYYDLSAFELQVGSKSPVSLGNGVIEESVDRHLYHNNQLICAIECKTYLDKCYMQRVDSDFNLMKTDYQFEGWIVSLENGIADNSSSFFMGRKNIDKLFYLATGKRNSAINKRIYYHPDRIQLELIETMCENMEKFFND